MSKSLLLAGALALLASAVNAASYINYTTIPGFFLQDEAATVPENFSYTATNFGLIDRVYDSDAAFDPSGQKPGWARFENYVNTLNAAAPSGTQYKVLYLGRHGEGYHNVAETYYGTPAWNCYWAELDGNGTSVWSDADITPRGTSQAVNASAFWSAQVSQQGQSLPQAYYTSPLTRCLHTAELTFGSDNNSNSSSNSSSGGLVRDFAPRVREAFREGISMHTCDRRGSKSYIAGRWPRYTFDASFTEDDELWKGFEEETSAAEDVRLRSALDSVFSTADADNSSNHTFVSVTSHSGAIASALRVLGHQSFGLVTGAVIPVLVRAQTLDSASSSSSEPPTTTSSIASWDTYATCTVPPITSLATGGCVCPSSSPTASPTSVVGTGSAAVVAPGASNGMTAVVAAAAAVGGAVLWLAL